MNKRNLKRLNQKYPIYLDASKLDTIPRHAIYVLCPSLDNLSPFYTGTSRNPVARYVKYVRGATKNNWQSHESTIKLKKFAEHYKDGISPVMVLVDEARSVKDAKRQEKAYREQFTEKGFDLLNKTGVRKSYVRNSAKRVANDLVDSMFDGKWFVLLFVGLAIAAIVLLKGQSKGEEYMETRPFFPHGYYQHQ